MLIISSRRSLIRLTDKRDLDLLVSEIFSVSEKIRYVEIFDEHAKGVAGGMRQGVISLDPPRIAESVDTETARYALLLISQKHYYGDLSYMLVEMEKLDVLVLPLKDGALVLTTEPGFANRLLPMVKEKIAHFLK